VFDKRRGRRYVYRVGKSRRDRIIELGRRIAEQREALLRDERELDSLLAENDGGGNTAPGPNSLGDRLLRVLRDSPAKAFRADELMDEARIPTEKLPTVRTTLARLASSGLIVRAEEKGTYRIAPLDETSSESEGATTQ
jgi:hypothetical protein